MAEPITLTLVDGARIVVPDSLNLITPYVLMEQQDWFEDEIRFLRGLIGRGCKVIDIGANYGIYTLCMAKVVGAEGFVWAFEPSSNCSSFLRRSVLVNGFNHVLVEQSAVSSECGTGRLALNDQSEMNALVRLDESPSASEKVSLVTLDDGLLRYGWNDIDLLKIDAEGEELNILKGGRKFLADLSPLIQYELKLGEDLNLELVREFTNLGYRSYRLIPGIGVLVPFDTESTPDGYLLNLFCCKPDRAAQLAARGLLVGDEAWPSSSKPYERVGSLIGGDDYSWRSLRRFPFGAQLMPLWASSARSEERLTIEDAIACYIASRNDRLCALDRFDALKMSFELLNGICARQPSHVRLASLARVAADYGARSAAVAALQQLAAAILNQTEIDLSEPFLAPGERFDSIPPLPDAIIRWLLASVLEQLERLVGFSSFYTGNAARRRLEIIRSLGFGSPEMGRRLQLVETRFGKTAA